MVRNSYKREDVFVCRHESHEGFCHRVSAHHVLREKRCHPSGCLEFLWKCKLLGKGGACPKEYRHVGNNCTQCRHYDEEKLHRYPEVILTPEAYRAFQEACREFDEWLEDHEDRLLDAGGRVASIRPHLLRRVDGPRSSLVLRGFLLRLEAAYVGRDGLEDALYLRISRAQQQRHQIAVGDDIEALARISLDRGRLVGAPARRIRIEIRSGNRPATWHEALLDRANAVSVPGQPARCLSCERGVLIDIEQMGSRRSGPRREVLCLEGIGRPRDCPHEAMRAMGMEATEVTEVTEAQFPPACER
jgi:hypothetical protein